MTIYLLLIAAIIFLMMWNKSEYAVLNKEKKSIRLLVIAICLIYLLCILRASTVGRDLLGYKEVYDLTKKVSWNNFDYVYFEDGYILLMKICTKLKMPFQMFLAIVYFIILVPIGIFINDFSKSKLMSVIIYICYIFFEFDLTGLRQAIAISIVLLAFRILLHNKKGMIFKYVLLVLIAATFHKSALIALVFLPLFFIVSIMWYMLAVCAVVLICLIYRNRMFGVIGILFESDIFSSKVGFHIGGNLLFMCLTAIMAILILKIMKKNIQYKEYAVKDIVEVRNMSLMIKIFICGIILAFFFGESTVARSYMYFSSVIIVLIPNLCNKFSGNNKIILKGAFVLFFICFFYVNSLSANNFDIVPYSFFWQ